MGGVFIWFCLLINTIMGWNYDYDTTFFYCLWWFSFIVASSPLVLFLSGALWMTLAILHASIYKKKKVRRMAYEIELKMGEKEGKGFTSFCTKNYLNLDMEILEQCRQRNKKPSGGMNKLVHDKWYRI